MKWHLLHPAWVHFPIALLITGLAAALLDAAPKRGAADAARRRPEWLKPASAWLLWLGTAAAWIAMGLGLLAERTAKHVPMAWEELADHKTLAFWTVGLFTALSLWKKFFPERLPWVFIVGWALAAGVLLATAYHGGEVVFSFGMGVAGN